ncbi:hypothetical protein Nocox_17415 [Nonomuraea coxensis DSM 45129]|uniref:DinB family protein n=1 Tax=Nonomuraea coxensis DSM 45129 TaxID=1122611 RepID=A0ABX8U012_9ACTN|nr:hypothetical protein [Nonomuraea coxensis]QYC41095.1 hypothetical protein Nocox_17415 [Nonomuraea coxensis DSM 45129]
MTRVHLEIGRKKVFACSLDWPGWDRAGKSEEAALSSLMDYETRYRVVAERAGVPFAPGEPEVVARVTGDTSTDFGVPAIVLPDLDLEPLPAADAGRRVALMRAAWDLFDEVAGDAPEELRKGPRGGGRDRDRIVSHVEESERAFARKIGIRHKPYKSVADRDALRQELAATLSHPWQPPLTTAWPPRYALRRVAWHVLDHLWEIEDRR